MSILDLHGPALQAAAPQFVAPSKPEPKFSAWGLVSSVPRGVAEAGAQVMATGLEVLAGFGDTLGRMESGQSMQDRQPNMQSDLADSLRNRGREFRPDAESASTAEQLLYGFARGASKVVGGAMVAGPLGVGAAGAEEGVSAADDLARQGVGFEARTKAGAVQGAGLALAALPLVGPSLKTTAGLYLAGGPGGFMAQQALTREILRNAGHDKIAEQYDPFDPVGLAVSSLVPLPFVAMGVRAQRRAAAEAFRAGDVPSEPTPTAAAVREAFAPETVDAARVAYAVERRAASSLDDQLRGADTHEAALARAEEAMSRGDAVQVSDIVPPRRMQSLAEFMAANKIKDQPPGPEVAGNFIGWVRQAGGIDFAQKWDITNERGGVTANPGGIFRKGGRGVDDLALQAEAEGYLLPGEGSDSRRFVELVQEAVNGNRVLTLEEQGMRAARESYADEYMQRLEAVETRLKLLGEDTTPAKGNLLALEAYAKANEPAILSAALEEARAVEPASPQFEALQAKARQIAADLQDGGRTLAQYEAEVMPLSPVMRRLVEQETRATTTAQAPNPEAAAATRSAGEPAPRSAEPRGTDAPVQAAGMTPGAKAEDAAVMARLADVQAQHPDLMVQIDGMDKPMRLDQFLAAVKAEADEMRADAPLMEVAASCAILNG